MIKATIICTNCKKEKEIPYAELGSALLLDKEGELNLCSDCQKLWGTETAILRKETAKRFAMLQERFGIPR